MNREDYALKLIEMMADLLLSKETLSQEEFNKQMRYIAQTARILRGLE